MEVLTSREMEVARLVHQGKSNSDGAVALGISPSTFSSHLNNIFLKLGIHKRQELVLIVERWKK
jgi:DNA-binding CsgD family transcriptional regulator